MNAKKTSGERQPFFTADEWKRLVLFRPREWPEWYRGEPLPTKLIAVAIAAILAVGLYALKAGSHDVGWGLITLVIVLLGLLLVVGIGTLMVAGLRWILRESGSAALWRRIRDPVMATAMVGFWLGLVALILVGLWPYLSADPVKSWYALTLQVPVEQVTIEKEPHDCEFSTAPIGSKHCHYEAHSFVQKGADSPDGTTAAVVSYEKVED